MNRKLRALFIIHDVYQEDNWFPIGIAYLASVLRDHGVEVKIACQDVYHWSNEELAKRFLKKEEYDIIGLGFLSARFTETVLPLCKVINKYKKGALFVLGGHGASASPEYILEKTKCDTVVVGEAEKVIIDVLEKKIKGIVRGEKIKDLNSIPFPAWDLFPMDRYSKCMFCFGMKKGDRALAILTTRGCTNQCTFCYRMEKGIRLRSIANVIDEIKMLKERYEINTFTMADELFSISKKRVFEFEEGLKKNNLNIKYTINARVDTFDRGMAESLKRSGCLLANVGFESSSQKVLDSMNKNTTVAQNIRALNIARAVGLPVGLNFIWGFPDDTKETLLENAALIKNYHHFIQARTIRPVTPYPGSKMFYDAMNKGLLKDAGDFYNKFKNSDLLTVNFTNYPDEICYRWLYEVNKGLVLHYYHNNGSSPEAQQLIRGFHDLYFKQHYKFRGAR